MSHRKNLAIRGQQKPSLLVAEAALLFRDSSQRVRVDLLALHVTNGDLLVWSLLQLIKDLDRIHRGYGR
jgi:hypothetical protein